MVSRPSRAPMALIGLRFPAVGITSRRAISSRYYYATGTISKFSTAPSRANKYSKLSLPNRIFKVSKSVSEALSQGRPVVALETTIYTHGFPYPDNVALAIDLESIVYENGGIPATIGVLDGVATVGLSSGQLSKLASSAGKPETMKVSRRDLPYILGMGLAGRKFNGGTTISGTMFLAHQAGIKVFGTGGLGGVHRGGQDTMDISADLTELGRTPVAVISSGCKSFLDLPRTLEYLETQGAGVFAFADGRTGDIDFPSFFTRESGVRAPMVVQNAREAAAIIYSQSIFPHSSGLHFGNPIPEEFSIPKAEIDVAINQAVQEAADQGYHGHSNTPFILARIKDLTKGRSIPANRALIESNVRMATKVAVELAALSREDAVSEHFHIAIPPLPSSSDSRKRKSSNSKHSQNSIPPSLHSKSSENSSIPPIRANVPADASSRKSPNAANLTDSFAKMDINSKNVDVLVFGSVAVDLSCDFSPPDQGLVSESAGEVTHMSPTAPQMHTSNISSIGTSVGGVGHNVSLAIHRAGGSEISVRLHTFIGDDLAGNTVLSLMKQEGLDANGIITRFPRRPNDPESPRTAQYVAVNDAKKDLVLAMADMEIYNSSAFHHYLPKLPEYPNLKWIVVDANWKSVVATRILKTHSSRGVKTAFEPASAAKSAFIFNRTPPKISPLGTYPENIIDLTTPNQHELAAMHASAKKHEHFESEGWWAAIDAFGIPSSGARDRFVALTNQKMTDEGIPLQTIQLLPMIPTILTKLGADGVLLTELLKPRDPRLTDRSHAPYVLSRCTNGSPEVGGVYMRLFPSVERVDDVVSVNGVGDTFLGVLIAGLARGLKLDEELINLAQRGAVLTLRSKESVSPLVSELKEDLDHLLDKGEGRDAWEDPFYYVKTPE